MKNVYFCVGKSIDHWTTWGDELFDNREVDVAVRSFERPGRCALVEQSIDSTWAFLNEIKKKYL